MVVKVFRIISPVFSSTVLILALVGCTPNASSINKNALRDQFLSNGSGSGIPIDANISNAGTTFTSKILSSTDYISAVSGIKPSPSVLKISRHSDSTGNLGTLKSSDLSAYLDNSSDSLAPWEALASLDPSATDAEVLNASHCTLQVTTDGENNWKVSLVDSAECLDPAQVLSLVQCVTVTFRSKAADSLVGKGSTS